MNRAEDLYFMFLSLVLEGAPYILLGAVVSGIIDAYLPSRYITRLLPENKFLAIMSAGMLGAIFPVCECAIVPVIRRLVAKGLPISCAITYMLSAPIINPIVALSTWSAFQSPNDPNQPWLMMGSRLAMGYMIAVIVGVIASRWPAGKLLRPSVLNSIDHGREPDPDAAPKSRPKKADDGGKLVHAMRTAQKDFIDVAMYFTIGVLIASIFKTQVVYTESVQQHIDLAQGKFIAPLVLMALAFALSLCSTTDAFVIASDDLFGRAAKLAFLVFGPMMDVKLLFLYSSVFRRRFVLFLVVALALLTWLFTIGWQPFVEAPQTQ